MHFALPSTLRVTYYAITLLLFNCTETARRSVLYIVTNVAVKWLVILHRIREVLGSILDPKAGYPDPGFCDHPRKL
jgi:hypothetical protein